MLKNFKKSIYLILFFFIIISLFIVANIRNPKENFNKASEEEFQDKFIKKSVNITTSEPIYKDKDDDEYKYVLKDFEGKLAVFEKNKKEPEMIFDVSTDSLPELDIIELKQGLKIKDEEELNARIEDFIS